MRGMTALVELFRDVLSMGHVFMGDVLRMGYVLMRDLLTRQVAGAPVLLRVKKSM